MIQPCYIIHCKQHIRGCWNLETAHLLLPISAARRPPAVYGTTTFVACKITTFKVSSQDRATNARILPGCNRTPQPL
jgi:hypothetical protein